MYAIAFYCKFPAGGQKNNRYFFVRFPDFSGSIYSGKAGHQNIHEQYIIILCMNGSQQIQTIFVYIILNMLADRSAIGIQSSSKDILLCGVVFAYRYFHIINSHLS